MSDVDMSQGTPGTPAVDAAPTKTPDGAQTPAVDDIAALKAEIDRKEKLLKATQGKLAKHEEEAKKRADEALIEQGKFKDLADKRQKELDSVRAELTTYQDRIKAIETAQQTELDGIMKTMPEDQKKIIGMIPTVESKLQAARTLAAQKPAGPDINLPGRTQHEHTGIRYPSMEAIK